MRREAGRASQGQQASSSAAGVSGQLGQPSLESGSQAGVETMAGTPRGHSHTQGFMARVVESDRKRIMTKHLGCGEEKSRHVPEPSGEEIFQVQRNVVRGGVCGKREAQA